MRKEEEIALLGIPLHLNIYLIEFCLLANATQCYILHLLFNVISISISSDLQITEYLPNVTNYHYLFVVCHLTYIIKSDLQ